VFGQSTALGKRGPSLAGGSLATPYKACRIQHVMVPKNFPVTTAHPQAVFSELVTVLGTAPVWATWRQEERLTSHPTGNGSAYSDARLTATQGGAMARLGVASALTTRLRGDRYLPLKIRPTQDFSSFQVAGRCWNRPLSVGSE
jgi:hypothetical protein